MMTTLREAAQQALETLEALQGGCTDSNDGTVEAITVWCPEVIDSLRAALAEPVQPVAWMCPDDPERETAFNWKAGYCENCGKQRVPLYAAPPQRKPLTEEEIKRIDDSTHFHESPDWSLRFARAIERAHAWSSG